MRMKKTYLFFILSIFFLNVVAQSFNSQHLRLGIQKIDANNTKVLFFKPNKNLSLRTFDGENFSGKNYLVTADKIIFNQNDTISINEIAYIRGRVKGDGNRKVLGGAIVAGSAFLGFAILGLQSWASQGDGIGPGPAIPFIGAAVAGVLLLGPRSFDTSKKWELVLIEGE